MPVSSSTEHWIKPDALNINLNHFGDPDYLQVSVLAGAVVMAFKQDVIGYNAAHNYRTWPLEAANTYLETSSAYNVYARLTRSEVNARALIVYDTVLRDIEGREITYAEDGSEVLGDSSVDYFFVFLGQVSPNIDSDGQMIQREWIVGPSFGSLDTNQQKNDTVGLFDLMFRPHYDNPLDPNEITWIEALTHLGVAGGITMYANGGKLNIPSIYDGLPIDWNTLIRDEKGVLMVNPDIKLGGEGVSNFWDLSGIPSWITNSKPKYTYSEIEGIPDLTQYALVSQIPSLSGYATESWVLGKGYATTSDLDGRINALINGAPQAYDTLKEIADVLEGNVNSIGDILTTLGNKADKATTLSGYGITDAYTKANVNNLLKGYVTIAGTEDVTGIHNFTNGIKVGGIVLKKFDDGVVYIDGNLVVKGGVTMYGDENADIPTIYDGLPIDNVTIYWENTSNGKVLKSKVGTEGAITEITSAMVISALGFTPYDASNPNGYITSSALNGYATQTWVKNQGYLTSHQDLSGYQTKITSSNKLAYSLISGTPTSLKNPNALSFGSKSYDGSDKIMLTAGDLGALTSHQTIYTLTFASGTFASGTFTANSAKKTINIPTTTSHISEGSNLYFTNARAVNALAETLKAYVTLGGTQTITGEKNFTGGLKVNGSPIYYDSTKKYWKLEGDLLVTGGVTMYGSDSSFTPSTIMDAIAVDGTTISKSGGVLKVIGGVADSVAWDNITGKPTWIGSSKPTYSYSEITGAISTTELQNYLTSNSYLNVTEGDNRYLKLSGGTLSGDLVLKSSTTSGETPKFYLQRGATSDSYYDGYIYNPSGNISLGIAYGGSYYDVFLFGKSTMRPVEDNVYPLGSTSYRLSDVNTVLLNGYTPITSNNIGSYAWTSSNDGGGSGLDADLLDGVQLNELFTSLSSGSTNKLSITIGGVTKNLTVLYASYAQNFTVVWNNPTSGTYELNDFFGGYVRHYGSGGSLSNAPSNFGNGAVLALTNGIKGLSGQLAWNIVHNSTTNVTNKLWWRAADSTNGFTYSQWKQIAFTNSNVASATKLETARTIWGQSFDGSGNVSGNMTGVGTISMSSALTLTGTGSTTARIIMSRSSNNYINYPSDGILCLGTSNSTTSTQLCIKGATGDVGIGTTSPAYKLDVNGSASINGNAYIGTSSSTTLTLMRGGYNYIKTPASGSLVFNMNGSSSGLATSSLYLGGSSVILGYNGAKVGIGVSPTCALHVSGDILATGAMTFYSMRKLKNVVDEKGLSLSELSSIKPTRYTWKDGRDNRLHFGGIADDIQQVLPEVVYSTSEGILTMDYGNAAFAVASSLIKPVIEHEKRIAMLEEENKELRNEIERLKIA